MKNRSANHTIAFASTWVQVSGLLVFIQFKKFLLYCTSQLWPKPVAYDCAVPAHSYWDG